MKYLDEIEVSKPSNISDDIILNNLPKNNSKRWCKVEDGYIMNLLDEKKNRIPYD